MTYNIQFKRATAARIAEVPNTVLLAGEPLLDTTNNQLYIGDGTTTLSNLKPIQNTQGVLDDMVTKGLLTSTTTTTTTTHNYTTDILQLDSSNSPQGFISALDSTTAICSLSDSAEGYLDFKINLKYPVTTGTLSSEDLESMIQVATTSAGWGNISITWLDDGVETTFYKYIGDMTQTLTREGPFQYRINSENNIDVFIDPQTTLKSVAITNNYYCNNLAMVRLTNATYESTESVTTYALNLPTATTSNLGLVQPDNNTITVDGNGVISAVNNSIAKTAPVIPLKYEEQENGVSVGIGGTLNHTNYIDSADRVYVDTTNNPNSIYNQSNGGWYYQSATNMMSKLFYKGYKVRLDNGLNVAWNIAVSSGFFMNVAIGYYNNGDFVPVLYVLNSNSYGGSMFAKLAIELGTDTYNMGKLNTQFTGCVGISLQSNILTTFATSGGRYTNTISDTTLLTELQKCTHAICTVINEASTGTTFNYSTGKFVNPETTFANTDSDARDAIFSEAENLILNTNTTVVPELKLNYDSNTLGVNASNELTVPTATTSNLGLVQPDGTTITINNGVISAASSMPSNMVTTDTSQTIAASKAFHPADSLSYCQIGGYYGTHYDGYISAKRYDSNYPERSTIFTVNLDNDKSGSINFSDNNLNSIGGLLASYNNLTLKSRTGTYYVQKNNSNSLIIDQTMLDGTTINYNSTSGKIEIPVDGTYIIYDSNTGKVTLDLAALKTALDAL